MNQETYFVTTDAEGMGRRENPFNDTDEVHEHVDFALHSEALPTYSQNNVLIRNERVEVEGPVWQGKLLEEQEWSIITKDEYDGFEFGPFITVRQIYFAVESEKEQVKDNSLCGLGCDCKTGEDCHAYPALRTVETEESGVDWPEDLSHENGNYKCKCGLCGRYFQGHKRRVRCRYCATTTPISQPVKEVKSAEEIIADSGLFIYEDAEKDRCVEGLLIAFVDCMHAFAAQYQQVNTTLKQSKNER